MVESEFGRRLGPTSKKLNANNNTKSYHYRVLHTGDSETESRQQLLSWRRLDWKLVGDEVKGSQTS